MGPAGAESAANGFMVKISAVIHAAPEEVYQKLVHNVGGGGVRTIRFRATLIT